MPAAEAADEQRVGGLLFGHFSDRLAIAGAPIGLQASVSKRRAGAGDPSELVGVYQLFAEENRLRAAVVDVGVADLAVEEKEAVVILVDRGLDVIVTAGIVGEGNRMFLGGIFARLGGAHKAIDHRGPNGRVCGGVCAGGGIELAKEYVFLHVRQDAHEPANVAPLRLAANRAAWVRDARRQSFEMEFKTMDRQRELNLVVDATRPAGGFTRSLNRWQQQGYEYADDRNDHKQLDKRKSGRC